MRAKIEIIMGSIVAAIGLGCLIMALRGYMGMYRRANDKLSSVRQRFPEVDKFLYDQGAC